VISHRYESIVERIFQTGRNLTAFRNDFDPIWKEGFKIAWLKFLDHCDLHRSTASKYMKIAAHPVLSNRANWPKLPRGIDHLYELAKGFEDRKDELDGHLAAGRITQAITLDEIADLVDGEQKKRREAGAQKYLLKVSISIPPDRDQFKQDAMRLEQQIDPLLTNFVGADIHSNLGRLS